MRFTQIELEPQGGGGILPSLVAQAGRGIEAQICYSGFDLGQCRPGLGEARVQLDGLAQVAGSTQEAGRFG